jgi:hypothetical protein
MNYASIESKDDFPDTPEGMQRRWITELAAGKKFGEKWCKAGDRITKVFLDERQNDSMFGANQRLNVFTANIQTLRAMMFGQVPRVEISRRYEDANDDAARVAAEMLERLANADVGKQFSYSLGMALDDRLLVGFGLARVAYEADFETIQHEPMTEYDENGEEYELAPGYEEESKTFEAAPVYYVNWRDVRWSPARSWDELRWIAFRAYLTRDELIERFGETIGKAVPMGKASKSTGKGGIQDDPWQKGEVWEVWCREEQKVYWCAEGMEVICDAKPDPLKLREFFPTPQFMIANPTSKQYAPRADYILAQDQYEEVNEVSTRITMLQKAIKVVGVYDKQADGVQRMLTEAANNELIPVDNWAMFAEKGGIKGQVDWLPIEEVAKALQYLRDYRTELLSLLFQVTGMSDIIRGSTQSGETATAQSIKAKFASTRVQFQQDEFARYATDLQKLRVEVMAIHFDDETLIAQANMQNTPDAEYIGAALELIRSLDAFRIVIKSETLAAQDMASIRQEKSEFIQGLAAFLQAAQPLIEKYPSTAPTLLEMLKWTMSGFKGASTIEGVLDKAIASLQQNPPPTPPNPAEEKAKAEQAKSQGQAQQQQLKSRGEMQREMVKAQNAQKEIQSQTQADLVRIGAESEAETKKQAMQFAFDTRENQRADAIEATRQVTERRPQS